MPIILWNGILATGQQQYKIILFRYFTQDKTAVYLPPTKIQTYHVLSDFKKVARIRKK